MTVSDFFDYMKPGKVGHLIGIGGVSMSPLAEVLNARGITVQGSDMNESEAVAALRKKGISVAVGHSEQNICDADFIVRTAAVRDDNVEIQAAHRQNIPVFERTQAWGAIMREYRCGVCIAGTHGKTTTTSMMTHITLAAEKDPTVMIGGTLPILGSGYRLGAGDTIVLESCEYYNSFHNFSPTVAVILNVDNDHLDFFGDLDGVKASFRTFAEKTAEDGWVIANGDDANTMSALRELNRRIKTFGLSEQADFYAKHITEGRTPEFDVFAEGTFWAHIRLNVAGTHNIYNALAACAAAYVLGISPEQTAKGLEGFRGAGRRLEWRGKCGEADVYDDYAHHPGEIEALLNAVSTMGYERILMAFQPHTYSRTIQHFEAFLQVLSGVDKLWLAEIFAAREQNTTGISAKDLAEHLEGAVFREDFAELAEEIRREARAGDIILTVGAGNINRLGDLLIS